MVVLCLRRPASRSRGTWRPPAFFDDLSVNQNWQQVETAADWISCSLPGLSVAAWRPPAFSTLLGTQLHGTPARRGIPRRPSNQTFVAVPKLKKKHISSTTVSTKHSPPAVPRKNLGNSGDTTASFSSHAISPACSFL